MNSQTHVAIRHPHPICSNTPLEASSLVKPLNNALHILRMKQLVERTKLSRATLYMLIATDPSFPRKINLTARTVGFFESELEGWISSRAESRFAPAIKGGK